MPAAYHYLSGLRDDVDPVGRVTPTRIRATYARMRHDYACVGLPTSTMAIRDHSGYNLVRPLALAKVAISHHVKQLEQQGHMKV